MRFGNNSTEFYGGLGAKIDFNTEAYKTLSIGTVTTSYTASPPFNPWNSAPKVHIYSGETDITTLDNGNKNIMLDISAYDTVTMELTNATAAGHQVTMTNVVFK